MSRIGKQYDSANCIMVKANGMIEEQDWKQLIERLNLIFKEAEFNPDVQIIRAAIANESSSSIALAMEDMEAKQAVVIFAALEKSLATEVLAKIEPGLVKEILLKLAQDKLSDLVEPLSPREAAAIVVEAPRKYVRNYLKDGFADPSAAMDVQQRLSYPKGTAGRLMTSEFVRLPADITVEEALIQVKSTNPEVDIPSVLFVTEQGKEVNTQAFRLLGVVSIRDLIMSDPKQRVAGIMATDVISIPAIAQEEDAAALLSKYKFMALPVTDTHGYLVGIIPADDLMKVVVSRLHHLYMQSVGTDAKTMESLSPFQAAKLRVPWLLGTMVIELLAGMVISHYDVILTKVILLASFMPVISAISGNVGLQSAAITVRALDTKDTRKKNMWTSLVKEGSTSLIMAVMCGLVLGTVGAVWSKHIPFGIVICGALICSTITAGLMGTIIPIFSKRLGFDPATTAGPFETAFQDVVGFAVFLGLATQLQHWIS